MLHWPEPNFSISIKIISDPFHLKSDRNLKLKCISDLPDAMYIWSMVNGTLSANLRVRNDMLLFKPFTELNAGTYECIAYSRKSPGTNIRRRIHFKAESSLKTKRTLDVSRRIDIKMLNDKNLRLGKKIQLKCSISRF